MDFTYSRDDARHRVEIVSGGAFEADAIISALQRQRDDGSWHYATLSDARGVTGTATLADLERLCAVDSQPSPNGEPRGPLAIVVADPTLFRKACAYAILIGVHRKVNVFDDRNEAERWLLALGF